MVLSHPYQTGGFHAPVVRIVRYGVHPRVARCHFAHLVAGIIEQPLLLLCAIVARQPISRYPERKFTQAQRIYPCCPPDVRDGLLSLPAPDPGGAVGRTTAVLVDRGHASDPLPIWMLSTGAASSAASVFTGQPAMPARRSDPVTVLRQLRGAGQCRLYS